MMAGKARRTDGWVERARERMAALGLTYDQLAEPLSVSTRGAVSHYLNRRRELSAEQAVQLADLLGCSVEWLLTGSFSTPKADDTVAQPLPRPEELGDALAKLRPDAYAIVARLISEVLVPDARSGGRKARTPKK